MLHRVCVYPLVRAAILGFILLIAFAAPTPTLTLFAQDRPDEPLALPPVMSGEVPHLSPEFLARLPTGGGGRVEIEPSGQPAFAQMQPFDPEARVRQADGVQNTPTFVVNYLGDSQANDIAPGDGVCADAFGRCGLRTAVQEANALLGLDTILLPAGVITLATPGNAEDAAQTGDLDLTDSVVIRGAGAGRTFINANGIERVFHALQIALPNYITVDLVDLSIYGGDATFGGPNGGGGVVVGCRADAVLLRVNVFDNIGVNGGGVVINASDCPSDVLPRLVIYESAIFRNAASGELSGGGIDLFSGGTLHLINSTVARNTHTSTSSSISAGILIGSSPSNVATIRASTIIDNTAPNATLATPVGLRTSATSTTTILDSVIARNIFGVGGGTIQNCGGGGGSSGGGNVYDNATGCPFGALDLASNDSLVNLVGFNAPGQTPTAELPFGSQARDFGKSCLLPRDQRGVARPLRACSSGAYQVTETEFLEERPPGDFTLIAPAVTANTLIRELKWQSPIFNIVSYDVIARRANGSELLRRDGVQPSPDGPLICEDELIGNVVQPVCTLTLTRAQTRKFLPNQTYRWEVVARNNFGSSISTTSFALNPTSAQSITNGGFEADTDTDGVPDAWTAQRPRADGIVCNTVENPNITPFGTCAYRLVGEANKNSTLRQAPIGAITRDSLLVLGGQVRATGPVGSSISITLTVRYATGPAQVKTITLRQTNGYRPLTFFAANTSLRLAREGATVIVVSINNRATGGRAFIDDLSLSLLTD